MTRLSDPLGRQTQHRHHLLDLATPTQCKVRQTRVHSKKCSRSARSALGCLISRFRVLFLKTNRKFRQILEDFSLLLLRSRLLRAHHLKLSGKLLSKVLLPSRLPSHLPPHNRVLHPRLRCNSSVSHNQQHCSSELRSLASNRPISTCSRLHLSSFQLARRLSSQRKTCGAPKTHKVLPHSNSRRNSGKFNSRKISRHNSSRRISGKFNSRKISHHNNSRRNSGKLNSHLSNKRCKIGDQISDRASSPQSFRSHLCKLSSRSFRHLNSKQQARARCQLSLANIWLKVLVSLRRQRGNLKYSSLFSKFKTYRSSNNHGKSSSIPILTHSKRSQCPRF